MSLGEVLFNNEQRSYINHICASETIPSFTRQKLLNKLVFQQMMLTSDSDEEVVELVKTTLSIVKEMSDDEWDEIRPYLPLPCVDADDELEELY